MAGKDTLAAKVRPSLTRKGETAIRPEDNEVPDSSDEAVAAGPRSGGEAASEPAAEPAAGPQPGQKASPEPESASDSASTS